MPRTWLSVHVDLMSGRGEDRPGRIFAAARAMTFGQLAAPVADAFGRWDLAHLHTVELADGLLLIGPGDSWDDPPQGRPVEPTDRTKLSRLSLGEQFAYTFDLGADWTHLCTVGDQRIDPYEALGEVPERPAAYLHQARSRAGLSQRELAQRAGVSQSVTAALDLVAL